MTLEDHFLSAVDIANELTERPSDDILLRLYALYKQSISGDAPDKRPQGFDFKAIAKYNPWASMIGRSKGACMQEYIDLVKNLQK